MAAFEHTDARSSKHDPTENSGHKTPDFIGDLITKTSAEGQTQEHSSTSPAIRQYIENSLHLRTSIPGYLTEGGITGMAMGAANSLLGKVSLESAGMPVAGDTLRGASLDGLGTQALLGAGKGIGVAAATLAAGYVFDSAASKIFGYRKPEATGLASALVDGVAVPATLLSELPAKYKLPLAAAMFLGDRVADAVSGSQASTTTSGLLRPNIVDAVGLTAAAMAPVDGRTKAVLIGGAYAAGRIYNEVAHLAGWDKQPYELRDDSLKAISEDESRQNIQSFETAVAKGKDLGKENEAALELQMRDWMDKQTEMPRMTYLREAAATADALGQFRLEEGNRLDPTSHQDSKPRILKGLNYDFGGGATTWLRYAAGSLVNAQNDVTAHKGQTINGVLMDDKYEQQLKALQTNVEEKLNVIYGRHDMAAVFKGLKAGANEPDLELAVLRLKNQIDVTNTSDKNYRAKQYRDLSLGYLVEASSRADQKDGVEAAILYKASQQSLKQSEQLVGRNLPDNQGIEKLQQQVAKDIPSIVDTAVQDYNNAFLKQK